MSKPVEIRYRWNRENVEKLFDSSYQYLFNHSAKRYIGWLFIAILQFSVVATLKKGSIGILLFSSMVLLYWYYGKKSIARRRVRKSFEASPFKDKTIAIDATDAGLDIQGSEGAIHWDWEEIDEVIPLEEAVMIYRHPHFHYIPASGFASLEEKSRFKSMAKRHHKLSER